MLEEGKKRVLSKKDEKIEEIKKICDESKELFSKDKDKLNM